MKIQMQSGSCVGDLTFCGWDHAIIGQAVDDRGKAAVAFCKNNSKVVHEIEYESDNLTIKFDGIRYSAEAIGDIFQELDYGSFVLDATTMGFVEILMCSRALKNGDRKNFSILYAEPESYFTPQQTLVHRRKFDLSLEVKNFSAVPGNVVLLRQNRLLKVVVLAGFEGQRVSRFLNQTETPPSSCSVVFGVPAYHPGWEMNAFVNNFEAMDGNEMAGRIYFCGAQNPLSAYLAIEKLYKSCSNQERVLVVPVGTKPHGIGAALFACQYPDVGVVYDNPKRKDKRSKSLGSWHLYDIVFQ